MSTSPGAADYPRGRLLYRGAEADVIRGSWQGLDAVFKVRKPLGYRLEVLDKAIRHHRTLREAEMIHRAKEAGVGAPRLYHVDPAASTLVMEYIRGRRVRDLVSTLPPGQTRKLFDELGRDMGRLHSSGIMHGDLTTANLVRRRGALVFLDFGLSLYSKRIEDHAVDLRLIKETIFGAHHGIASVALRALLDGYSAEVGDRRARAVQGQLAAIERRGRYARVA